MQSRDAMRDDGSCGGRGSGGGRASALVRIELKGTVLDVSHPAMHHVVTARRQPDGVDDERGQIGPQGGNDVATSSSGRTVRSTRRPAACTTAWWKSVLVGK